MGAMQSVCGCLQHSIAELTCKQHCTQEVVVAFACARFSIIVGENRPLCTGRVLRVSLRGLGGCARHHHGLTVKGHQTQLGSGNTSQ